ncbi:hypothetical protein [Halovivax limisalsi]|uniref:hypothetical protein n=1 Tax=Halovivax limisalsi TaxID=1453760 RepID=UPI001FFC831F|nr:hypothetical protein [Halovivax limisalsi]
MRLEIRPRVALLLLLGVLVLTVSGSIAGSNLDAESGRTEIETESLEDGSEVWPYTSRTTSTDGRTLAINIVVYGDADATERFLREQTLGDWEEVDEDETHVGTEAESVAASNESTIAWGSAAGAVRYAYLDPADGGARWVTESYQLKDGTYLGDRQHIRAYTDPVGGDWTVMQAHREHWDWFQLRHSVHTVKESQAYVESEFIDSWYVESLSREYVGNDRGADSDGWTTFISLRDGVIPALLGLVLIGSIEVGSWRNRTEDLRAWWNDEAVQTAVNAMLLATVIVSFFAFVRIGAVEAELAFPETSPKVIVAVFYPLLVLGLPIATYLGARHLERIPAFTAAALGFVVAMFLDYTTVGVVTLSLATVVHHISLATALGFVAAGASETARSPENDPGHVRTGVLLWLVTVGIPLLQFL